ncbi:trimeric intracellular cation channel family protein [Leucothrix sargassi]|nr:trimeric intracellular cation channel family protein [Leucothrix sargassi]
MSFELIIQVLTIFATVTLAISGVIQAARSEMDFFGALVIACVCALGGGSLRDLLIGAAPVFWTTDLSYLMAVLPTTLVSIIAVQFIPEGKGIRTRLLDIADAVGLGLFAILGAQKALHLGFEEPIAVTMGVITGVAGGMIRDVLSQSKPLVMVRGDIYASAAIIGTIIFTILRLFMPETTAMLIGMVAIISVRLLSLRYGLKLPLVKFYTGKK